MKKLFTNYNFSFNKNERKLASAFCKQILKQTEGNKEYFGEQKAFSSILEKLNSGADTIKLTKDELTRFRYNFELNISHLKKSSQKGFFIKKWIYKSLLTQYNFFYESYLKD